MGNTQASFSFTFPDGSTIMANRTNAIEVADSIRMKLQNLSTFSNPKIKMRMSEIRGYVPNQLLMQNVSMMFYGSYTGTPKTEVELECLDLPFGKEPWFREIAAKVFATYGFTIKYSFASENVIDLGDDDDEDVNRINIQNLNVRPPVNPPVAAPAGNSEWTTKRALLVLGGHRCIGHGPSGDSEQLEPRGDEYYDERTHSMKEIDKLANGTWIRIFRTWIPAYGNTLLRIAHPYREDKTTIYRIDTSTGVEKIVAGIKTKDIPELERNWRPVTQIVPIADKKVLVIFSNSHARVYQIEKMNGNHVVLQTRFDPTASYTLMQDGRLFVISGTVFHIMSRDLSRIAFGPHRRSFSREVKTLLLSDGRIFFCDGRRIEYFNPQTNSFEEGGPVLFPREDFACALMPDDKVFISGGKNPDKGPMPLEGMQEKGVDINDYLVKRTEFHYCRTNDKTLGPYLLFPRYSHKSYWRDINVKV